MDYVGDKRVVYWCQPHLVFREDECTLIQEAKGQQCRIVTVENLQNNLRAVLIQPHCRSKEVSQEMSGVKVLLSRVKHIRTPSTVQKGSRRSRTRILKIPCHCQPDWRRIKFECVHIGDYSVCHSSRHIAASGCAKITELAGVITGTVKDEYEIKTGLSKARVATSPQVLSYCQPLLEYMEFESCPSESLNVVITEEAGEVCYHQGPRFQTWSKDTDPIVRVVCLCNPMMKQEGLEHCKTLKMPIPSKIGSDMDNLQMEETQIPETCIIFSQLVLSRKETFRSSHVWENVDEEDCLSLNTSIPNAEQGAVEYFSQPEFCQKAKTEKHPTRTEMLQIKWENTLLVTDVEMHHLWLMCSDVRYSQFDREVLITTVVCMDYPGLVRVSRNLSRNDRNLGYACPHDGSSESEAWDMAQIEQCECIVESKKLRSWIKNIVNEIRPCKTESPINIMCGSTYSTQKMTSEKDSSLSDRTKDASLMNIGEIVAPSVIQVKKGTLVKAEIQPHKYRTCHRHGNRFSNPRTVCRQTCGLHGITFQRPSII